MVVTCNIKFNKSVRNRYEIYRSLYYKVEYQNKTEHSNVGCWFPKWYRLLDKP